MIPYEDLVAALSAWRIKQGLPVDEQAMAAAAAAAAPPADEYALEVPRATPPAPPRSGPMTAPPLPPPVEVDDAAMLEEAAYDSEGGDFAMAFDHGGDVEATSIGEAPDPTLPPGGHPPGRDDW